MNIQKQWINDWIMRSTRFTRTCYLKNDDLLYMGNNDYTFSILSVWLMQKVTPDYLSVFLGANAMFL